MPSTRKPTTWESGTTWHEPNAQACPNIPQTCPHVPKLYMIAIMPALRLRTHKSRHLDWAWELHHAAPQPLVQQPAAANRGQQLLIARAKILMAMSFYVFLYSVSPINRFIHLPTHLRVQPCQSNTHFPAHSAEAASFGTCLSCLQVIALRFSEHFTSQWLWGTTQRDASEMASPPTMVPFWPTPTRNWAHSPEISDPRQLIEPAVVERCCSGDDFYADRSRPVRDFSPGYGSPTDLQVMVEPSLY